MSYEVDFYPGRLDNHFISDILNIEFWAPSNKGHNVFLCRADEKVSNKPPRVGSIQHFTFKKKFLNLRVSKIVYDIKRNAYRVFLNYTHDNKKPFDYKHKVIFVTMTLTETYPKAFFDWCNEWIDNLKEQFPGSGVPKELVTVIVPSEQEIKRSSVL